jgi:hypothetical protein
MKEKLEKMISKTKNVAKNVLMYGIVIIAVIASFIVGFTYHKLTTKTVVHKKEIVTIRKSDITVAVDENSHLIIINNETGDYTLYEDSVGKTIFKLYAANVWGQHIPVTNVLKK